MEATNAEMGTPLKQSYEKDKDQTSPSSTSPANKKINIEEDLKTVCSNLGSNELPEPSDDAPCVEWSKYISSQLRTTNIDMNL